MTTKMHQCIEMYRDVMEGLIDNAVRINKEMGMLFYQDKQGNCTIGDICTGDSCSVFIAPRHGAKPIASFHVHPSKGSKSDLSYTDIINSVRSGYFFECVGSKEEGLVCYIIINSSELRDLIKMVEKTQSHAVHNLEPCLRSVAKLIKKEHSFYPSSLLDPTYSAADMKIIVDLLISNEEMGFHEFYKKCSFIRSYVKYGLDNFSKKYYNKFIRLYTRLDNSISESEKMRNDVLIFYHSNLHKIINEYKL